MAGAKKLLDLAKGIIGGEPQKTVSAYKLFRQKGDDLYPLFVNANKPVPMGEWLEAESGPLIGGKVKSSLGPLAYRPGWHAGDLPIATHIGGKSQPGLKAPDYRPDNQVWAEVLMPDDVDWQTEALARAQRSKAGNIIPRTAHITDQIPLGGHYRYKTNPNMTGEWLIGGSMKVNRVLPDDEVRAVNEGAGVSDLPRLIELMQRRGGYAGGGRVGAAIELAKRLGRMLPEGSGYRSVPGKPAVVNMPGFGRVEARPIPEIENAAAAYNRAAGLGDHAVESFAPLHPGFSAKVAREFDRMPSNPSDPVVRRSYDALVDETLAQYRAAKDTGIDFRFLKPGQADPYAASPALGYEDIVNKGRLFVFPTDQGFGTLNKAAADSPLLRRVGRIGDKDDAVANDAFRIVHDLYGHYGPGNPFFRAPGEERAYQLHSKMFSRDALPAATAETRGQNSWVNYGPAGEVNRSASGADTIYADQKVGVMPEWTSALPPAAGVDAEDYIRSLIGMRPRRSAGGSLIQDRHPTRYLPHVGRQVMADGGAASPSMNDLMATVNSVFSRSRPAATRESLTGVSSSPYIAGPGAYTDAGGMKIEAPFVTGMKDGYPVPPIAPAPQQEPATEGIADVFGKNRFTSLPRIGYAGGGSKFIEAAADIVAKAREAAKAVRPSQRAYVYHNLNADKIEPQIERFNGIVAPSLAISKPSANPVDFGNVTLIGRQHLAIPGEDHPVFRADAYTPRMPRIFDAAEWNRPHDFIFKEPGLTGKGDEVPATPENIVRHMRSRGILGGEGERGLGLVKAMAHPPFKSLDEIQSTRHMMPENDDEYEDLWDSLRSRATSHGGVWSQYADTRSSWPSDQFIEGLVNYQRGGIEGLKETYPRLPQGYEGLAQSYISDLKNAPASYYEAKPMRAVGFDEFGGALMPIGGRQSERAAEALAKAGVPQESILFYNPAKHGHRYQMLRESFGDLGFADGGSVDQAMDIARSFRSGNEAGDIMRYQHEMRDPLRGWSSSEVEGLHDVIRHSHAGDPVLSKDGRRVERMGGSGVAGKGILGAVSGSPGSLMSAARLGVSLIPNPVAQGISAALSIPDMVALARRGMREGHVHPADVWSSLPTFGGMVVGAGSKYLEKDNRDEAASDVFNRMRQQQSAADVFKRMRGEYRGPTLADFERQGYATKGAVSAVKKVGKAFADAAEKFIPLEEARARVASPFSNDPDVVEAARKIVESFKVPDVNKKAAGSYYGVKQTRLPSEVTTTRSDIPGVVPLTPRDMTWEDFVRQAKGGTLINVSGDRSDLRRIHSINGRDLAWDVDTYAGPKYMLEPNENAVWANDKGHGTGFQNAVREAAKRGPVFGVYHPMGPQSVDFAHHMFDALMAQIAHGDVSKRDMERVDQIIRSGAHAKENQAAAARDLAGWPGFANAEESSDFARSLPGARRSEIIKFLDKEAQLRQGFPAVGETRVAITDPAVLMAPENMLGHRIVQFDPDNIRPEPSSFIHSTYDVPTGGRYVGDVPLVQSQYVMPEVERSLMTKLASGDRIVHPFSPDQYGRGSWRKSFETRKLGQPINDEMLDSIMLGMQRQKDYGFRKGGSVVKLARDVISRKRDAA